MAKHNPRLAAALTLFGLLLMASFFCVPDFWKQIDEAVFFFFNDRLLPGTFFLKFVAYTNKRSFDLVSAFFMGLFFLRFFWRSDNTARRLMVGYFASILLLAMLMKQWDSLLPITRKSPTLVYSDVNRITKLAGFATKDSSGNCFPGDHGMMLMIFTAYMARYFGRRAFCASVALTVIFTLPRIMSGAHWFTDIYVGALAMTTMTVSWLLLTSLGDRAAMAIQRLIPRWLLPVPP